MKVIETLLGNWSDPGWKARLEKARIDVLTLDQWQAQKNRFRLKTDGGIDLAGLMEGALRSGARAAAQLLASEGSA